MADNRTDSAHVESEIFSKSMIPIDPPECVKLQDHEMPFFKIITDARAEWTKIDLIHAANLARCFYSIEENTKLLAEEGDVVTNKKGTQVMNPRFTALEQLTRRSVNISSKIQVHALATQGESKQQRNKNTLKRQAQEVMAGTIDDDDIARPH